jgi:dihydroneopterin aldolase
MQQQIILEQLALPVRIGIHDFELVKAQPYLVDIALSITGGYTCSHDEISETVNYDKLRDDVTSYLTTRHFNLQETVVQGIVAIAFALDHRVQAVEVNARKTTVYPDCAAVGLRYQVSREDLQALNWPNPLTTT